MRLLLDINVFLDVVFKRPGEAASADLFSQCGQKHEAWLAWHSVATLAYLIERQSSAAQARDFISGLLTWARVVPTTHEDAVLALSWPMPDFEDALQAAAARACGASYIITRNECDFLTSPVAALSPDAFLAQSTV